MSLGKTQSNFPNFKKESRASSSQNEGTTIYGKKLNEEGVALVVDNKGTDHDIWVQEADKKGYFRVNSGSMAYMKTPVKRQVAEEIIESWKQGYEAQGVKPESQKPKFAVE